MCIRDSQESIPIEEALVPETVERVIIQPIIVSDTNGTNRAEFFGTAQEEAETLERIDRIFNQAGVEVQFLEEREYNDTRVNTRLGDSGDLATIISEGERDGVANNDPNVINVYFVQDAPGEPSSSISALSAGLLGENGVAVQAVESTRFTSREQNAHAVAQGIARNLGLDFLTGVDPETDNLLNPEIQSIRFFIDPVLTDGQNAQVIASEFTRPV